MKLYIGNKNYSSWSMRPWVMLKNAGVAFEEIKLRFDSFDSGSQFKQAISKVSPVAKVPLLLDDDLTIWDTLAIAEYAAETFPDKQLWPTDKAPRCTAASRTCAALVQ
jgi:glutathione S-transferase